jgi:dynein heavy chain
VLLVPGCCLQGNCLLAGVGGSGKQSLARLAAYAAGCGVFEITLTRGYDEAAFREDLKELYTMLGAENKKMVFLFTDSHVADEGFLELINNMLTTGACHTQRLSPTALCAAGSL